MKWAKSIAVIAAAMMVTVTGCSTGGGSATNNGQANGVSMVADIGGLHDQSFNQGAWQGITKLHNDTKVPIKALESNDATDYVPNLTNLARQRSYKIIWGIGFNFENPIEQVSSQFPTQTFGIVDSDLEGNIPKNVVAVTFKEEQGSFLEGVIAGLTTKTNKIGFIGGVTSPLIKKFEDGFKAGVYAVNPKATVTSVYAESFADEAKGRAIATSMYNSGIDIIYAAAGGTGNGLFDEVKTLQKGKYWAIGVDIDQNYLAPGYVLSSMVKNVNLAVYNISKEVAAGKVKGGTHIVYGLEDNGVDYSPSTKQYVAPSVLTKVDAFKQQIISGQLVVPSTDDQLATFMKSYKPAAS